MAVVEFTKDGQGFYNFDALLELTSEKFVAEVKSELDTSLPVIDIKVVKGDGSVTVYVVGKYYVTIFRWSNTGFMDKSTVLKCEIEMLGGFYNHGC